MNPNLPFDPQPSPDDALPISQTAGGQEPGFSLPAPKIDGYEILHKIDEAGQGQIWAAVQQSTSRKVAVKVPRFQGFGARKAFLRFEREVQVIARLKHPNIARVYDSGVNRGFYYYTMEYIEGRHLDRYAAEEKLSRRDILMLFERVCRAVEYAHQNAVIHRDLKPSNILVTADGQPHIVDFGLAKEMDDLTVTISMDDLPVGTPAYMSPEQAEGRPVDTRSDIYSLGVILYRLLTGTFPHDMSGSRQEVLRRIAQDDIIKPVFLTQKPDKELEYILRKALAKEAQRRYSSVQELAQDIENYLAGRPLLAGPESAFYIVRKFIWRHRTLVLGLAGGLSALVVALVAISLLFWQAQKAKREIQQALEREERLNYRNTIQMAHSLLENSRYAGVRRMLEDTYPSKRSWEWGYLMKYCQLPEKSLSLDIAVDTAALSTDGRFLILSDSLTQTAMLMDSREGTVVWQQKIPGYITGFVQAAFDPSNRFAAVASGTELVVFDIADGHILFKSKGIGFLSCCAGPAGLYAGTFDGHIFLYDTQNWQVLQTAVLKEKISLLAIAPDGTQLAALSGMRTITLHDPHTLQQQAALTAEDSVYQDLLVLSAHTVASASGNGFTIDHLTTAPQERSAGPIRDHLQEITALALSASQDKIITGGLDGVAHIYDARTGQMLATIYHDSPIQKVFFLPSDKVITLGADGRIKWWSGCKHEPQHPDVTISLPLSAGVWQLDYDSDGRHLVFATSDCPQIVLADAQTGSTRAVEAEGYSEEIKEFSPRVFFRPGKSELILKIKDSLRIYALKEDRFEEIRRFPLSAPVGSAAVDPKGRFAAVAYLRGFGILIDLDAGSIRQLAYGNLAASYAVFSPDGSRIVFLEATGSKRAAIIDSQTGRLVCTLFADFRRQAQVAAFHPNLPILAIASSDGVIQLWNIDTSRKIAEMTENGLGAVYGLQFSRDGQRLLSGSHDKTIRLWDWTIGSVLLKISHPATPVDVCFSPDGLSIACAYYMPNSCRIYRAIPLAVLQGSQSEQ